MERIIEDVLTVVDVDWEMMAAIFVLELDGVLGVHFSILYANHARCRLAIEESQALGVALQRDIKQVKRRKSLKRIAWNGEHRACGEEEQLYKAHSICGEVAVAATCSTIFFTFLTSLRYAFLSVSFICRASIALSTSVNSFPSYGWLES